MEELAKISKEKVNETEEAQKAEVAKVLERIPKDTSVVEEVKDIECPHCGLNINSPRIEVSEEDRAAWMRHILSGGSRRFEKDYTVYGGRVGFRLKSRNGLEDRDIDIATNEYMHSVTDISDFNKIRVEMMKIQLLYSLDYIFYVDLEHPEETRRVPITSPAKGEIEEAWALNKSAALKRYTSFLEDTPTAIMSLMCDKLAEFNATVSVLTIEGLRPDF